MFTHLLYVYVCMYISTNMHNYVYTFVYSCYAKPQCIVQPYGYALLIT